MMPAYEVSTSETWIIGISPFSGSYMAQRQTDNYMVILGKDSEEIFRKIASEGIQKTTPGNIILFDTPYGTPVEDNDYNRIFGEKT